MSTPTVPTAAASADPGAPRPPARPHPVLVVVAVLVVLVAAVGGVLQLLSTAVHATTTTDTTYAPTSPSLAVTTPSGDVSLVPSADGLVHVRTQARHGLTTPDLQAHDGPAGLVLDADCQGFAGDFCQVTYTIALPATMAVTVRSGGGDVVARDLTGRVAVQLGAGDATFTGLAGDLSVHTVSGDVVGTGLRSPSVLVQTTTGDVTLASATAPSGVTVTSRSGDVDVAVPAGSSYRVVADSPSGRSRVLLPPDPAATATLSVTSDHGDVTVRPA
ncbi:hypothetical protein Psed_2820 [Pseudonocardia dioxanivorans CB1190]|uniref:DUF4097 domain-containing protein n=1 Tax=Pseudonocardia dioxanivorans (strain ATCC 55486 / DSM 44775 / JCM 13855 / CB1190) TaxID=675635 RepID=F4CL91_PSEUX|nr:DUF4097 family beta strand repeat-containing protein [Pseudonocardia dioxanivorans]AEA25020.1 hypothetical protein Psed_2820 [Pseudonocardia dioxanivorans CB1190]